LDLNVVLIYISLVANSELFLRVKWIP